MNAAEDQMKYDSSLSSLGWKSAFIRKQVVDFSEVLISSSQLSWQYVAKEGENEEGENEEVEKNTIEQWKKNMYKTTEYADEIFIQLFSELVRRKIVLIPVHKNVGHNSTGRIDVMPNSKAAGEPMFFLYYTECKFVNPHYQSIRLDFFIRLIDSLD